MAGERTLPGLGLTGFWDLGSAYKPGMDENLRLVSALLDGRVKSRTTVLPGTPTLGDIYIVRSDDGTNPNKLAIWDGASGSEAWVYVTPHEGWMFYVLDEDTNYQFDGAAWAAFTGGSGGGSVAVHDEGAAVVGVASILNFVGDGVVVTDGGGGTATITIPGGGTVGGDTFEPYTENPVNPPAAALFPDTLHGSGVTVVAGATETTYAPASTDASVITKDVTDFESILFRVSSSSISGAFADPGVALVGPTKYVTFGMGTNGSSALGTRCLRWTLAGGFEVVYGTDAVALPFGGDELWYKVVKEGSRIACYYGAGPLACTTLHTSFALADIGGSVNKIGIRVGTSAKHTSQGYSFWSDNEDPYLVTAGGGTVTIEEVPMARSRRAAAYTVPASATTIIPWDTSVFDNAAFFNAGTPSRFTIPAGVTAVVLDANIRRTAAGGLDDWVIAIRKNGSNLVEYTAEDQQWGPPPISTGVIQVVEGDYFDVTLWGNDTLAMNGTESFFSIYAVQALVVAGGSTGGGSTTFVGLTDTPASFGTAGYLLAINGAGTAVEFIAPTTVGVTAWLGLSDTPGSYGTAGQVVLVNATADGLEFGDAPTGLPAYTVGNANQHLSVNALGTAVEWVTPPGYPDIEDVGGVAVNRALLGPGDTGRALVYDNVTNEMVLAPSGFNASILGGGTTVLLADVDLNGDSAFVLDEGTYSIQDYDEIFCIMDGCSDRWDISLSADGGTTPADLNRFWKKSGTGASNYENTQWGSNADGDANTFGFMSIKHHSNPGVPTVIEAWGATFNDTADGGYMHAISTLAEAHNAIALAHTTGTFTAGRLFVIGVKKSVQPIEMAGRLGAAWTAGDSVAEVPTFGVKFRAGVIGAARVDVAPGADTVVTVKNQAGTTIASGTILSAATSCDLTSVAEVTVTDTVILEATDGPGSATRLDMVVRGEVA